MIPVVMVIRVIEGTFGGLQAQIEHVVVTAEQIKAGNVRSGQV